MPVLKEEGEILALNSNSEMLLVDLSNVDISAQEVVYIVLWLSIRKASR